MGRFYQGPFSPGTPILKSVALPTELPTLSPPILRPGPTPDHRAGSVQGQRLVVLAPIRLLRPRPLLQHPLALAEQARRLVRQGQHVVGAGGAVLLDPVPLQRLAVLA